jgi:hypothetical protein
VGGERIQRKSEDRRLPGQLTKSEAVNVSQRTGPTVPQLVAKSGLIVVPQAVGEWETWRYRANLRCGGQAGSQPTESSPTVPENGKLGVIAPISR